MEREIILLHIQSLRRTGRMNITTRQGGTVHVSLDVHKDTISVAVAWHVAVTGELRVEDVGVVSSWASQVLAACGGCRGTTASPFISPTRRGSAAPTLIPRRSGDRVKTDRGAAGPPVHGNGITSRAIAPFAWQFASSRNMKAQTHHRSTEFPISRDSPQSELQS